jgi:hypothetical protein
MFTVPASAKANERRGHQEVGADILMQGLLPKRRVKKGQVVQVPKYSVTKVLTTENAVQTEMW